MNRGKFQIVTTSKSDTCFWRYKAPNGETLCHSEQYSSIQAARNGIRSIRFGALMAKEEVDCDDR